MKKGNNMQNKISDIQTLCKRIKVLMEPNSPISSLRSMDGFRSFVNLSNDVQTLISILETLPKDLLKNSEVNKSSE